MVSTLKELIDKSFLKNKDRLFLEIKVGLKIRRYTYGEIDILSRKAARLLARKKIKKGDKVLIWGMNSPEWAIAWIACLRTGIVSVPVDFRTTIETAKKFAGQTKPKLFFVSKYLHAYEDRAIFLEDLIPALENEEIGENGDVKPNDLAEIVFTSGTTGNPKGVMLSQKNILASVLTMRANFSTSPRMRALSIMPLSHILEQVVGLLIPISNGASIAYLQRVNSATIIEGIRRHKATAIIVVPRILALMLQAVERRVEREGKTAQYKIMIAISKVIPSRKARRILFRKIHAAFGGKLDVFVCGGAPLETRIGLAWETMGFRVIQGYGSTETSGLTAINVAGPQRMEYAGKLPENAKVEISADGEVLVKGDFVSKGYWNDEEKTKVSFDRGWYKTGDMGKLDKKWLKLMGREKFRIVLSDGRKIYPEDIETKLGNHPDIKACCIVPIIRNGEKVVYASILTDKKGRIDEIIKEANKTLESAQQISYYGLWEGEDFPRTRTLKVDREAVEKIISDKNIKEKSGASSSDSLIQILSRISRIPASRINEKTNIVTGLKLDSLGRIELISQIEEEMGVVIEESKIGPQSNVAQIRKLCKAGEPYEPIKRSEWARSLPAKIARIILQSILFQYHSLFIRLKVRGKENLKKAGRPCIFYLNHIGTFDVFCALRVMSVSDKNRVIVAATSEIWRDHKIYAFWFELLVGAVPIDREGIRLRDSLEYIGEKIDEGYSLIIFPEGKVSKDGKMGEFMKGVGLIATELELEAVPMKINQQYRDVFPERGGRFEEALPLASRDITFDIGKPLSFKGMEYDEATELMEKKLREL